MKKAPDLIKQLIPSSGANGTLSYGVSAKDRPGFGMVAGGIAHAGMTGIGRLGHTISKFRRGVVDENGNVYKRDKATGQMKYGQFDSRGRFIAGSDVTDPNKLAAARLARRNVLLGGVGSIFSQGLLAGGRGFMSGNKDGSLAGIGGSLRRQGEINAAYRHGVDRGSTFSGRLKEIIADVTGYEFDGTAAHFESAIEQLKDRKTYLTNQKKEIDRRNSELDKAEEKFKLSQESFNSGKNEFESSIDGDKIDDGLSGKAQLISNTITNKCTYLENNQGKIVDYKFDATDVGRTFNDINGRQILVDQAMVASGATIRINSDESLLSLKQQDAKEVKKDMTAVIAQISNARGKNLVELDLSEFSKYGNEFNSNSNIDGCDINVKGNIQFSNQLYYLKKSLENGGTFEVEVNGIRKGVKKVNDNLVFYDGNNETVIANNDESVINFKGLKKVSRLFEEVQQTHLEERTKLNQDKYEIDRNIETVDSNIEIMEDAKTAAVENRTLATTVNKSGLEGGPRFGRYHGGPPPGDPHDHGGPHDGSPPPGMF